MEGEEEKIVKCECVEPVLAIHDQIGEYVDKYSGFGYDEKPPITARELHQIVKIVRNTIKDEIVRQCNIPVSDEVFELLDIADRQAEESNVKGALEALREVDINVSSTFYKTKCM